MTYNSFFKEAGNEQPDSGISKALKTIDQIATTRHKAGHDALNLAGGLAFASSPQAALYRMVATSLWSGDGYYEKQAAWLKRFQENVARAINEDVRFPFSLAAFGRDFNGLSLRSSPVALYAEASTQPQAKGTGLIRQFAPKVLRRADDPSKALQYLRKHHGSLPHGVTRGIADTLAGFDAYQLGKYKQTGQMRDVIRIARPKPKNDEQSALWGAAVGDGLPIPYTWETEISKAQDDNEKREAWNQLLKDQRLGIFALMRNIRNILRVGADIEEALDQITEERVVSSGILPFQWYKAWKAVSEFGEAKIASVFMEAITWSLAGIEKLPGVTLVVVDNSGSMADTAATRGMTNAEIGNLMGAMAISICENAVAGTFGSTFALANTSPMNSLLENKRIIDECGKTTGHNTNAYLVFQEMIRHRVLVDRVIIFSDMQLYDARTAGWNKGIGRRIGVVGGRSISGELDVYQQTINPNIIVYCINLATSDNSSQFNQDQPVVSLAGWSDSILRFISAMEVGDDVLDHIRANY